MEAPSKQAGLARDFGASQGYDIALKVRWILKILHDPKYLIPWELWDYGRLRSCRIFSIDSRRCVLEAPARLEGLAWHSSQSSHKLGRLGLVEPTRKDWAYMAFFLDGNAGYLNVCILFVYDGVQFGFSVM